MNFDDDFEELPTGGVKFHAVLDAHDFRDIRKAILKRSKRLSGIPDAVHDDATYAGRVIAEICRGWMDLYGDNPGRRRRRGPRGPKPTPPPPPPKR